MLVTVNVVTMVTCLPFATVHRAVVSRPVLVTGKARDAEGVAVSLWIRRAMPQPLVVRVVRMMWVVWTVLRKASACNEHETYA